MRSIDALAQIRATDQPVLSTRDVAVLLKMGAAHASKLLQRLEQSHHIVRLKPGLWAFSRLVNPMALPQYLAAPFPSYISLQSALYHHGMIEQVPEVIYAVSLARTRRIQTPLGTVSFHHVAPGFFCGFDDDPKVGVKIATPEKAILDILYLRPAKSKLFRDLPELELPKTLDVAKANEMIDRIAFKRRRSFVRSEFERLCSEH